MAAPNLLFLTTVNVKTAMFDATASAAEFIAAVATGHAYKLEALFATNVHASVLGTITVWHRRSGTDKIVVLEQRVPLRSTVNVLLGAPLYLEEGDSVKVQANAASNVRVWAPYADLT
jgi:hypothetical protein